MARASDDDALTAFAAKNESGLKHTHDRESSCMLEHVSWNCSLGYLPKFAYDRGAMIHGVLFSSTGLRQRER